jgi:heme-degrading monooxygenase HmoA
MDILVQHTVRDYDQWKRAFDDNESTRAKFGCRGHTIYRGLDDRDEVSILTSWESREGAQQFVEGPSLKEAMENGDVISEPRVTVPEESETHTYAARRAA